MKALPVRMILGSLFLFVGTAASWSQIPSQLHFQGILTTTGGVSVPDGAYTLTFRLYTVTTGGTAVWVETHSSVTVSSGIFSVMLGSINPLNLSFDQPYYLGITVGSGAELSPRIPLTATAYSFRSRTAETAVMGGDVQGMSTTATVVGIQGRGIASTPPSTGQVLSWNGSQWAPMSLSDVPEVGWLTTGNVLTGNEFIGSLNQQPVIIKVDDQQVIQFGHTTTWNAIRVGSPYAIAYRYDSTAQRWMPDTVGLLNPPGHYSIDLQWSRTSVDKIVGGNHWLAGRYSAILGGYSNRLEARSSTIVGGGRNEIFPVSVYGALIGGGYGNQIWADSGAGPYIYYLAILGGFDNQMIHSSPTRTFRYSWLGVTRKTTVTTSNFSLIASGDTHQMEYADYGVIVGGYSNAMTHSTHALIGVGSYHRMTNAFRSAIGSGERNSISNTTYSVLGGGKENVIEESDYAVIGGGQWNRIEISKHAGVSGGISNRVINSTASSISSGQSNLVTTAAHSSIGGGAGNKIERSGTSFIGGGWGNQMQSGVGSAIGGGGGNTLIGWYSVIGGGLYNVLNAGSSVIGGGNYNEAGGYAVTIAGGSGNVITNANYAVIGGGNANRVEGYASVITGGRENNNQGHICVISGGEKNYVSGSFNWVGGYQMSVSGNRTFVWGYSSTTGQSVNVNDAFLIGPYGNSYSVGINVSSPTAALHVKGSGKNPLRLEGLQGSAAWSALMVVDDEGVVWTTTASSVLSSQWALSGNTLSGGEFLGSLNAAPVIIKVNNDQVFAWNTNGSIQRDAGGDSRGQYAVDLQYVRSTSSQVARGGFSVISGGAYNAASGDYSTVGGGNSNLAMGSNSTIGGGVENYAQATASVVSGGSSNIASGDYSSIGGGSSNVASGIGSAISGGMNNTAIGDRSIVSGGEGNTTAADDSWVGGRKMYLNSVADRTFVWGYATSTTAITAADAFLIGPYGNSYRVGINLSNPVYALELPNNTSASVGKARANDWVTYSDGRIKSQIREISNGLMLVQALHPVWYVQHSSRVENGRLWIDRSAGEPRYGFLAQEVALVLPEAVIPPAKEGDMWGISYLQLIPVLTAAIQEQQEIINQQRQRIEQLESEIQQLRQDRLAGRELYRSSTQQVQELIRIVGQLQQQVEQLRRRVARQETQ